MMSRIAVCIGAFVVLLVASALAGPVTLNGAKISATFNPTGGSIKIWETGTNRIFTHSFTKIQEVAADGGVVNAVNSFADLTFNVRCSFLLRSSLTMLQTNVNMAT